MPDAPDASSPIVRIVDYDPLWPEVFLKLEKTYKRHLGSLIKKVEHVGSTAVPGLAAKPIIDIDIVIESYEVFEEIKGRLAALGYVYQGDLGIRDRHAFGRRDQLVPWQQGEQRPWMEHHLYVCPEFSKELKRHLALRDYLRRHPAMVQHYGDLKRDLATIFVGDRQGYTAAKTKFLEQALAAAFSHR